MILVSINVNTPLPDEVRSLPLRTKFRRIDLFGSLTFILTVGCLLLGLSLKSTEQLPWSHPLIRGPYIWQCSMGGYFRCCRNQSCRVPRGGYMAYQITDNPRSIIG